MPPATLVKAVIALAIGVAIGLLYGWVVDPVEYVDATPESLRADYRVDYVLMAAEAYQAEQDASLAARRLAIFGSEPPAQIVNAAIKYAHTQGFTPDEITLLQELLVALQTYQPAGDILP